MKPAAADLRAAPAKVRAALRGDMVAAIWLLQRLDLEGALTLMAEQARGRRCPGVH